MQNKRVTICACASRPFVEKEKVAQIAAAMDSKGWNVTVVVDLCRKVMNKSTDVGDMAEGVVMACYPRAVQSHFHWLELKAPTLADIRNNDSSSILAMFGIAENDSHNSATIDIFRKQINSFPVEKGTDAWYPVIDKERCVECGKCHDFCLFGVYTVKNSRVKVTNPANCKNNCPACARMCPEKAIIFPKYVKSPVNGGTDLEETFSPEEMERMYRERLKMRLQQRRESIPLIKKDDK